MITQYASPVVVNPSQNFWLEGDGVTVSSNIAVPSLDLNFLTGQLPSNVTFTRADAALCASYFDSTGIIQLAAADEPRFDYDPVTLQPRGFLIEQSRANLILFSDAPATQSVTVSATAYTLSFYGSGTVTLSGTATATVVGTGAFPTRTTYTFTPTAGSLTLTITGTVEYANLEAGAFATSWIATTASPATRSADVASVNTLSPWYNASASTLYAETLSFAEPVSGVGRRAANFSDGTTNNRVGIGYGLLTNQDFIYAVAGGVLQASVNVTGTNSAKIAAAWATDDAVICANGGTVGADTPPFVVPTVTQLDIGSGAGSPSSGTTTQWANGWVRRITYYPRRLSNAELQALTA